MANRAKNWTAPRQADLGDPLSRLDFYPHNCRRQRCFSRLEFRAAGKHYPHKGANCHHQGENPLRCPIHGILLQTASGDELGKRYPAPLCLLCLPPHAPGCSAILTGHWGTCSCLPRLRALGKPLPGKRRGSNPAVLTDGHGG